MGDVTVGRNVGNGRFVAGQVRGFAQLDVHHFEQVVRPGDCLVRIQLCAKHRDQSRYSGPESDRSGGGRQPALHTCGADRVRWQPTAVAIFLRQVHQNRVGVGQHHTVVIDGRHLAETVDRQIRRLLVLTFGQIDEDQLGRQLQQGQHQLDTVGVTGTWKVVEFDRLHGRLR
ncbi:hypothetical protein D1872_253160 [compost metagenome]